MTEVTQQAQIEDFLKRKDLKIEALLQKVASLTARYENDIADCRVEITMLEEERDTLLNEKEAANVDVPEEEADTTD